MVLVALLVGAGAALALMVTETRSSSAVPEWIVGTFHTRTPYPSVIRILPSGEAHHLILDVVQGAFVGRGVAAELPDGWVIDFRYADGAALKVTLEPNPAGITVVKSTPDACVRPDLEMSDPFGPDLASKCRGELEPAILQRGALCRTETDEGLVLVDSAASETCDWTRIATQVVDQCCRAARFFDVGTCRAAGLDARLEECRRFTWHIDDDAHYAAALKERAEPTPIDGRPPEPAPAWMVGTFHSETPYPAVVRIQPWGRVVHLILDTFDSRSIGRGVLERDQGVWVANLRYQGGARLKLRFERREGAVAVAEANPVPIQEVPRERTCGMYDTSRPSYRWQRRPTAGTVYYASLRRPVEFSPGALCQAPVAGQGLLAVFGPPEYEPCSWSRAAKHAADECCDSARRESLGQCHELDPDGRLEECWRIARSPWD